jgi:hypothetical protein
MAASGSSNKREIAEALSGQRGILRLAQRVFQPIGWITLLPSFTKMKIGPRRWDT